jgi:hypothetical protein
VNQIPAVWKWFDRKMGDKKMTRIRCRFGQTLRCFFPTILAERHPISFITPVGRREIGQKIWWSKNEEFRQGEAEVSVGNPNATVNRPLRFRTAYVVDSH